MDPLSFRRTARRMPSSRTLVPPLTIVLALATAVTLLLSASVITIPPTLEATTFPSPTVASGAAAMPVSGGDGDGVSEEFLRGRVQTLPLAPAVVAMVRFTYQPGANGPNLTLPGQLLLVVEAGTLTARIGGSAWRSRAGVEEFTAPGDILLRAGDGLVVPAEVASAFRNEGKMPVLTLTALVAPAQSVTWNRTEQLATSLPGPTRWPAVSAGVAAQPLAGGRVADMPIGSAEIGMGQITLHPEESRPLATTGPVAIAVAAGVLTIAAGPRQIWLEHASGEDEWIAPGEEAALLPGDGVLFHAGFVGLIRNDGSGPLLLDLLIINPSASGLGPATLLATPTAVPAVSKAFACGVSCMLVSLSVLISSPAAALSLLGRLSGPGRARISHVPLLRVHSRVDRGASSAGPQLGRTSIEAQGAARDALISVGTGRTSRRPKRSPHRRSAPPASPRARRLRSTTSSDDLRSNVAATRLHSGRARRLCANRRRHEPVVGVVRRDRPPHTSPVRRELT